eukprot:scaffold539_cov359-Prasinococcus_capsulatus_cf.AAC.23
MPSLGRERGCVPKGGQRSRTARSRERERSAAAAARGCGTGGRRQVALACFVLGDVRAQGASAAARGRSPRPLRRDVTPRDRLAPSVDCSDWLRDGGGERSRARRADQTQLARGWPAASPSREW